MSDDKGKRPMRELIREQETKRRRIIVEEESSEEEWDDDLATVAGPSNARLVRRRRQQSRRDDTDEDSEVDDSDVDPDVGSVDDDAKVDEIVTHALRTYFPSTKKAGDCMRRLSGREMHRQQTSVVNYFNREDVRGLILFHEVGSGKTLTAVVASQCYLDRYPARRVLFIAGKSLVDGFRKELMSYAGVNVDKFIGDQRDVLRPVTIESLFRAFTESDIGREYSMHRYDIMTYGKFLNRFCFGDDAVKRDLCEHRLLIIDEAHNIRNRPRVGTLKGKKAADFIKSQREGKSCPRAIQGNVESGQFRTLTGGLLAFQLLLCSKTISKVLFLTATPVYNNIMDLGVLLYMMEENKILPLDNPKDVTQIIPRKFRMFRSLVKKKNVAGLMDLLRNRVSYYSIPADMKRRLFPTPVYHEVFVPMDDAYLVEYQKIESDEGVDNIPESFWIPRDEGEEEEERRHKIAIKFMTSIRQAVMARFGDIVSAKIGWLRVQLQVVWDIIHNQNEKVIIFTTYTHNGLKLIRNQIEQQMPEIHNLIGVFHGPTSSGDRQTLINRFNQGKLRVLIINIKAGGEGLNLFGVTRCVIVDPAWNDATENQAIARGLRLGGRQHAETVHVYRLYLIKPNHYLDILGKIDVEELEKTSPSQSLADFATHDTSVDFMMRELRVAKQSRLNFIIDILKLASIERGPAPLGPEIIEILDSGSDSD